jgi:hypothetical protein
MKIRELLEQLKKPTTDDLKYELLPESFFIELNLESFYWINSGSLVEKGFYICPIAQWLCTDTWVGYEAVFFKDQPLAITYQSARKNNTKYFWIVPINEVRNLVMKHIDAEIDTVSISQIGLDDDISMVPGLKENGIHVVYSGQVVNSQVIFNGRLVDVVKKYMIHHDIDDWQKIGIMVDGKEMTVAMDDVIIPYNTKDLP